MDGAAQAAACDLLDSPEWLHLDGAEHRIDRVVEGCSLVGQLGSRGIVAKGVARGSDTAVADAPLTIYPGGRVGTTRAHGLLDRRPAHVLRAIGVLKTEAAARKSRAQARGPEDVVQQVADARTRPLLRLDGAQALRRQQPHRIYEPHARSAPGGAIPGQAVGVAEAPKHVMHRALVDEANAPL